MPHDLFAILEKVVADGRVSRVSTVTLYGEVIVRSSRPDHPTVNLIVTTAGDGLVVDHDIPENEICALVWFDAAENSMDLIGWLTRREAEQLGKRVISQGETYFLVNEVELLHDPEMLYRKPHCD